MNSEHEIVLYQVDDTNVCVNVYFADETFWMTTRAMAELFGVKTPAITKHLGNIYEEEELTRAETCSKMEQVQIEGDREVRRLVDCFNLDAIIAGAVKDRSVAEALSRITKFQADRNDWIVYVLGLVMASGTGYSISFPARFINTVLPRFQPPRIRRLPDKAWRGQPQGCPRRY